MNSIAIRGYFMEVWGIFLLAGYGQPEETVRESTIEHEDQHEAEMAVRAIIDADNRAGVGLRYDRYGLESVVR